MPTILIPWRTDTPDGHRVAAYEYVHSHMTTHHPDWPIVTGHDIGHRWSKGRAVNDARHHTTADVLVVLDADCIARPDDLTGCVATVTSGAYAWAVPHGWVTRWSKASTAAIYTGGVPTSVERAPCRSVPGGGCTVIRADVFDTCPIDPRFEGWGGEDLAWGVALAALHGEPYRAHGMLYHLWHPPVVAGRARSRPELPEVQVLVDRYLAAARDEPSMRRLVGEACTALAGCGAATVPARDGPTRR